MSKIFLIFIAISLAAANPFEEMPNKCLNYNDDRRCVNQCKLQGSEGGICDKVNGCICETPVQYADEKVLYEDAKVLYDDEKIQCHTQEEGFDPECHHYCARKGFDVSFCDRESVCNCQPLGVPYEQIEPSDDDEKIMCITRKDIYRCRDKCQKEQFSSFYCKRNEECQCEAPFEPIEEVKSSCNPLVGDFQCYNFCKDHGLRKGECVKEGYCSCIDMDVVPLAKNYYL